MRPTLRENLVHALLAPTKDTQDGSHLFIGYVFGALGAMLFSLKAVFVKLAYLPTGGLEQNELEPITLMLLRMGFSLPVFIVILIWTLRRSKVEIPIHLVFKAAALGMLGYYICAFLDFTGLKYITAQLERLLLFTYPMFVVILGALFFGGRLTKLGLVAVITAYAGIALIFLRGDIATGLNVPLGSALILATAFLFAIFQLTAKRIIDRLGSRLFTCLAMIAASTAIVTHFLTSEIAAGTLETALHLPVRVYIIGASVAIFSTILPAFLINMALERVGAQAVAVLGMIGPIATIVVAIYILGEPFGPMDALGTAITLGGVGLYTWQDRRKRS